MAPPNKICRYSLVRSGGKRVEAPDVLTPLEIRGILGELSEPARTVTMLAAITGMRRGELFGLKWEDLDFGGRTIRIVRSLVDQIEGVPKTETSRKPLPMSDGLAAALMIWRGRTDYPEPSDWVFASPVSFGKLPLLAGHAVTAAHPCQRQRGWESTSALAGIPSAEPQQRFLCCLVQASRRHRN